MKRFVRIKNKEYTLTYDEYGVLDTVVLAGTDVLLSTKNRDVKRIVNNANALYNYQTVSGIEFV